jgi:AcrR family transcriptional regulator
MAQTKKTDKRNAILVAATNLIAIHGLGAPTAKIAKAAGVSDGSLFTYFPDKDDLLNQLYGELKMELREAVLAAYPRTGTLKQQARHLWDILIDWNLKQPKKRRTMAQLNVSDRITSTSKQAGTDGWEDIAAMMQKVSAKGLLRDRPSTFSIKILLALSELTMDSILEFPKEADTYRQAGFDAFWNAVAKS